MSGCFYRCCGNCVAEFLCSALFFSDLCLEMKSLLGCGQAVGMDNSQDSYPGFENSSMMDSHVFLFSLWFYTCVWSLNSGAVASPSTVRPLLAHMGIVIMSLCVSPLWRDSNAHQTVHVLGCILGPFALKWSLETSSGLWSMSRECASPPGLGIGMVMSALGTFFLLCELWRLHVENVESEYYFHLDFWVTWNHRRLCARRE